MYLKTVSKCDMQRQISNSMRWFRKKGENGKGRDKAPLFIFMEKSREPTN